MYTAAFPATKPRAYNPGQITLDWTLLILSVYPASLVPVAILFPREPFRLLFKFGLSLIFWKT